MLPGPRLLLGAALLLGTACCSSAAPGSDWISPQTPGHPHSPSAPQDASAGREGLLMDYDTLRAAELSPADPRDTQNRTRTTTDVNRSRTEPDRADVLPELNRTVIPSEFNRTDPTSEPNKTYPETEPTRTVPASEPNRTDPSSEPSRSELPSIPNRTVPPSEHNKMHPGTEPTRTYPTSEPNRTDPSSEPSRSEPPSIPTRTVPPSEPNRTDPPSEPNRTDNMLLFADIGTHQALIELGRTERRLGPNNYYRSEPDWMEIDASQTSPAAGITQKSLTQRHLNKRTPHMDPTYVSSTRGGDRTLLSVTKNITEIPNTYPTDSGNSTGASRIKTEDAVTTTRGYHNATEHPEVRSTYPLQTPSYVMTTYPSPTSPNATFPLSSVAVTATSTRGSPNTPGVTPNNSSTSLWSSSDVPAVVSSSSVLTSTSTPRAATSSTPYSQHPPSLAPSPPMPSTFPPSLTTTTPDPLTAMSSTLGSPSSYTSPFPNTDTTRGTETSTTLVPSAPPTDNTSMTFSPETPRGVTDERTTQDVTTALNPMETETTAMSTRWTRTESDLVGTRFIQTPAPTLASSTISASTLPTASSHGTTQEMSHDTASTAGAPILTTVIETTQRDPNTEGPKPGTTVSTAGRVPLPYPTPAGTTPAARHAATTTAVTSPTTAHARTTQTTTASPCASSPCRNGGLCVESGGVRSYRCDCPPAWSGYLCTKDVDECVSSPCPAQSTCINARGSYSCQCPLGYLLQRGAGCVLVRTFLGHIEIPWSLLDGTDVKDSTLRQIKDDIVRILNSSFSTISGYYQSTVSSESLISGNSLIVQNLFSLESNVTMYDLLRSLQSYARVCETSPERPTSCPLVLHLQHRIQALSLCHVRSPGCDNVTSVCTDPAGVAFCQCKAGYYKYSKADLSCRACDDGYKLEDGACVRCPFGLGGFNCTNPYQLIAVIIAAAGGGLVLILVVALTVTCCRKSKHDISKLIFKSGDFQMSPYAEYPKTQRSSDWGREAIEMQENGSTKNLLQMTDVYYAPGLRNSEMERNGLYPYTGLPGSRHSCIYPGQYNPSFINEENRRRDYF